jgi:hypothetical protein
LSCIGDDKPIYDNWTNISSPEYKKFDVKELTKNWRQQEDPEFFGICNKLRGSLSRTDALEILNVLNSRVVDKLPDNIDENDIHICGINTQVDYVNKNYKLSPGCKVICNMTCTSKEGDSVPNGSIGIVLSIEPFQMIIGGVLSTFKGIGKTSSNKPRFAPAYALTVHKAQGKTIKRNVIINPTRLFARNHLYVALTRATKFSNVFLTEKMKFDTFCKTVQVDHHSQPKITNPKPITSRLEMMVRTYIKEEPNLTIQFLQGMRNEQKNRCCYCSVYMAELFGESNSITLERVDDSKRHILSNVKLCCFACNSAHRKS